jgi:hypothetical protein
MLAEQTNIYTHISFLCRQQVVNPEQEDKSEREKSPGDKQEVNRFAYPSAIEKIRDENFSQIIGALMFEQISAQHAWSIF